MQLNKQILYQAVQKEILQEHQVEALWRFLQNQSTDTPQFKLSHVLYYLGGLLAIGAMTLFMNLGWEAWGGAAIVVLCGIYMLLAYALLHFFQNHQLNIPSALCTVFMVALVPLGVYGIQDMLGFWSNGYVYRDYHRWIDWRWLSMELCTLSAVLLLLWRYRYPLLVLPMAFTLWYMSMDISDWILTFAYGDYMNEWQSKSWVSLVFGVLMVVLAVYVDFVRRQQKDYAFWLYIFGVMVFWGGLSSLESNSEWDKLIYGLINASMIFVGVLLRRRVFAVFGGMGLCWYVGDLAYKLFKDSWLFPIALTLLGLVVVLLGVWWQKHHREITARLHARLPQNAQAFLSRQHD